ncbi:MAG: hypothetical protein AABY61_15965 [Nitrospirota bacterium]|jgi:hypothetical protein
MPIAAISLPAEDSLAQQFDARGAVVFIDLFHRSSMIVQFKSSSARLKAIIFDRQAMVRWVLHTHRLGPMMAASNGQNTLAL